MLVNAKIIRFVSCGKYADDEFIQLFKEAGIDFEMKEKPPSTISCLE
jgi:dCMP deaminase